MIRNIKIEDKEIIKTLVGVDAESREDIDYEKSGISFNENGIVDSMIIVGTRTLTHFFDGKVPTDDYIDDCEGSQEIIAYYSIDNSSHNAYKTFEPFLIRKTMNYSQSWYIPKDEKDSTLTEKILDMVKCKRHNMLVKRMT